MVTRTEAERARETGVLPCGHPAGRIGEYHRATGCVDRVCRDCDNARAKARRDIRALTAGRTPGKVGRPARECGHDPAELRHYVRPDGSPRRVCGACRWEQTHGGRPVSERPVRVSKPKPVPRKPRAATPPTTKATPEPDAPALLALTGGRWVTIRGIRKWVAA